MTNLQKLRQSKSLPFLLFFLLLLIPFSAYFLRSDFVGMDSYGFLLLTCQNTNLIQANGLVYLLFTALPCNFIVLKALLFLTAFVSGCFVIKLAVLFSPENGWRASYLLFLSTTTVLEFVKLENDAFGFMFMFASLYFFWKANKTGARKWHLLSFALLGVAGLIWQGAVFYALSYLIVLPYFFVLALAPFFLINFYHNFLYWRLLLGQIFRTSIIKEDLPFKFHYHFIAIIGICGIILEPLFTWQGLFLFALGIASAKFWILSLPFLIVGLVLLLEKIDWPQLQTIFLIVSLFLTVGLAQSVLHNPPTELEWNAVEYAVELANGNQIGGHFDYGYWVLWRKGDAVSYGSIFNEQDHNGISIFRGDTNCQPIKEFGQNKVVRC